MPQLHEVDSRRVGSTSTPRAPSTCLSSVAKLSGASGSVSCARAYTGTARPRAWSVLVTSSSCLAVMPCSVRVVPPATGTSREKNTWLSTSSGAGSKEETARVELGLKSTYTLLPTPCRAAHRKYVAKLGLSSAASPPWPPPPASVKSVSISADSPSSRIHTSTPCCSSITRPSCREASALRARGGARCGGLLRGGTRTQEVPSWALRMATAGCSPSVLDHRSLPTA
ncbi:hypothetical protein TSOC_011249 [Tetrabaena socialis]|uniref:Uncharacterized protein n=1 Tax=Tetrabaena socialis TaxID=47790 RepID=A0A2J7ZRF3_9CHLO|nr:hypothetical protein TSOC_011249 [Tetrabaena socialis]|eukprot:PNH02838.1 hypothetical protein TSOC_011249 [Tetrabaena socialis]